MASKERHADIVQDVLTFLPDDYIIDCVRPRKNMQTFEDIYCIKVTKDLGPDHELASDSARDGRDIFFHKGNLLNVKYDTLKTDQDVEFEVEKSSRGPRAYNIRILSQEA